MITRSIKMALKKIHEMCGEIKWCNECPFNNRDYGCFFRSNDEGRLPEDWDFDLLKGEEK